eukprot:CAMPEP_0194494570 /NCGR_PEP_ID=MMETSP0253-20130528/12438_1 /TAXON_ID=2966 /ORGANISM="Noctiluca scintillans" /LENGTH=121 /DNA_ID=CAMNT_0039335707 /DNA_START=524 /DNA_END=885 /DNA_ORIENTATION=+
MKLELKRTIAGQLGAYADETDRGWFSRDARGRAVEVIQQTRGWQHARGALGRVWSGERQASFQAGRLEISDCAEDHEGQTDPRPLRSTAKQDSIRIQADCHFVECLVLLACASPKLWVRGG